METRNCPNCAAPYDVTLNKCPYCGTSYFDMSAIDIYDKEPFYLKLKAGNMVFTSKVVVKPDISVIISQDTTSYTDGSGIVLYELTKNRSIDINIGFQSVVGCNDKNSILCTVNYEE